MFKAWRRRSAKVSYQPDDTQYRASTMQPIKRSYMKIIVIHPAGARDAPSIKNSRGESQCKNDDSNNYKQRRKTPCISSGDTPQLPWVEV
jgi:hypothetical protein